MRRSLSGVLGRVDRLAILASASNGGVDPASMSDDELRQALTAIEEKFGGPEAFAREMGREPRWTWRY